MSRIGIIRLSEFFPRYLWNSVVEVRIKSLDHVFSIYSEDLRVEFRIDSQDRAFPLIFIALRCQS